MRHQVLSSIFGIFISENYHISGNCLRLRQYIPELRYIILAVQILVTSPSLILFNSLVGVCCGRFTFLPICLDISTSGALYGVDFVADNFCWTWVLSSLKKQNILERIELNFAGLDCSQVWKSKFCWSINLTVLLITNSLSVESNLFWAFLISILCVLDTEWFVGKPTHCQSRIGW